MNKLPPFCLYSLKEISKPVKKNYYEQTSING